MTLTSGSDRIAIFGARGMAGSAMVRVLQLHGYGSLLTSCRDALDCLDRFAVEP